MSLAQLVAVFSLLPSILSKDKPALATSVMSFLLAVIVGTCLLSLQLWFSAATAYAIALTWMVLVIQKYQINHPKSK